MRSHPPSRPRMLRLMVNQVCFDIIGGNVTVTMAAEAGQLQLNVFEPIIAFRLLSGMTNLERACRILQDRCIEGITANRERMQHFVEQSIGVITALVPVDRLLNPAAMTAPRATPLTDR